MAKISPVAPEVLVPSNHSKPPLTVLALHTKFTNLLVSHQHLVPSTPLAMSFSAPCHCELPLYRRPCHPRQNLPDLSANGSEPNSHPAAFIPEMHNVHNCITTILTQPISPQ